MEELSALLTKLKMDHLEAQLPALCEQAAQRDLDYQSFLADALRTEWQGRFQRGIETLWGSVKPSEGAKTQSGSPPVIMMKTMENWQPDDLPRRLLRKWRKEERFGNLLVSPLMRTTVIEKGHILVDHPSGMPLTEDQAMVQASAPNCTEETLT